MKQDGLAKVCIFICRGVKVTIRVQKPRCLLHAHSAGVEMIRTAADFVDASGKGVDASVLNLGAPTALASVSGAETDAAIAALRLSPKSKSAVHDKVFVRDLILNTIVGVNPWERVDKQDIKLNLIIYSGAERLRQASADGGSKDATTNGKAKRDVVSKPHNYRTIVRSITDYVEASAYKTVESLATSIARVAIERNRVERIRVRVEKPSAIMFAASAGVEVERDRSFFEQQQPQSVQLQPQRTPSPFPSPVLAASDEDVSEANGWHFAAVALGSNLADRVGSIEAALKRIDESDTCRVVDTSFLYETSPMYVTTQPTFVNGACKIATRLSPHELLRFLQSVETALGRDRAQAGTKGPRSVDLDILFYDHAEVHDGETLTIPHPLMAEREFVLRPLADILPHYEHPAASRTVQQLLSILQNSPDYEPDENFKKVASIGRKTVAWGAQTLVMGILNATPDSFSDGGDHLDVSRAVATAGKMLDGGADLLDVGGMSTAPGAADVSEEEEIRRTAPLIRALRAQHPNATISIDTFRATVARAALDAGADLINDVSGGARDPAILRLAAQRAVPYICMHMRGDASTMTSSENTTYAAQDVVNGVRVELEQRVDRALRAGVHRWNLILDPGIGFAKDEAGNLDLLRNLSALTAHPRRARAPQSGLVSRASHGSLSQLAAAEDDHTHLGGGLTAPHASLAGFPLLLGPSRKRFLGSLTGRTQPKDRIYGTAAACTAAIAGGVDILRVHDVKEMRDVVVTSDAIFRPRMR